MRNPDAGEAFSAAMTSATACWAYNIADVIDTTSVERAVDVGGANGSVVRLLQQANPTLQAVVFDTPAVAEWARADIARAGFPDRTVVVGGDYFESVPPGDLYLLKFVLHNWEDQQCIEILRRCREAAMPGARIAIIEFVVGDLADPGRMAILDDMAHAQSFWRAGALSRRIRRSPGRRRPAPYRGASYQRSRSTSSRPSPTERAHASNRASGDSRHDLLCRASGWRCACRATRARLPQTAEHHSRRKWSLTK